jgi:hypothetical protein
MGSTGGTNLMKELSKEQGGRRGKKSKKNKMNFMILA